VTPSSSCVSAVSSAPKRSRASCSSARARSTHSVMCCGHRSAVVGL
jgi:hypothetical protein